MGPDTAELLDAATQARTVSLCNPNFALTEPRIVESWSAVRRMAQKTPSDSLLFLTPLSPLGEGRFEVKQLRRSRNCTENTHLIADVKISGAGLEHLYMTHDGPSGCKVLHGPGVIHAM